MRWRSKVVFFKAESWSGIVHLAGDARKYVPVALILGVLPRTKSRRPEAKPLARQTTPDHLPTCITFLALGGRAKDKKKAFGLRLWLYSYLLMWLFYQ